jgi:hypothetical protein
MAAVNRVSPSTANPDRAPRTGEMKSIHAVRGLLIGIKDTRKTSRALDGRSADAHGSSPKHAMSNKVRLLSQLEIQFSQVLLFLEHSASNLLKNLAPEC